MPRTNKNDASPELCFLTVLDDIFRHCSSSMSAMKCTGVMVFLHDFADVSGSVCWLDMYDISGTSKSRSVKSPLSRSWSLWGSAIARGYRGKRMEVGGREPKGRRDLTSSTGVLLVDSSRGLEYCIYTVSFCSCDWKKR